jgi:hypothetical protein
MGWVFWIFSLWRLLAAVSGLLLVLAGKGLKINMISLEALDFGTGKNGLYRCNDTIRMTKK